MEIFRLKDDIPNKTPSLSSELKITNLKPALRDKNRVNIFINNEFAFSLDLSQVVDFRIKVGRVLTPAEVKELESASEFGKLYSSTLEWVFLRPRSKQETRDHLQQKLHKRELENRKRAINREKLASDPDLKARQKDLKIRTKELPLFSESDIDKVIEKLSAKGYLDDEKFAVWYIENRNLKKGISKRKLKTELAQKGINSSLVENLLETSSRSDETEIKKLLEKKTKRLSREALKTPEIRAKLLRALVSKGFSYDLSQSLLEAYLENEDPADR